MQTPEPDVIVINGRIDPADLARLVQAHFEDMVKLQFHPETWRQLPYVAGAAGAP
jgi:hypothetical protein